MKFTGSVLAAAALTNTVSAHYFFDKLIVDGVETKAGQYVRANTRKESYMPTKWKNTFDNLTPDDNDFRCNLGAFTNAGKTQTMEIKAGAKLGMKLGVGATMQHPGPQMVYMSKAPTTAQAYEGDGEWFKIYEAGICDETKDIKKDAWCSWDKSGIDFTVPKDTPDGEYLIRAEHIGLHGAHDGQAEFYYECAQVKVTGGGNGTPGPTVKFPGAYKKTDPEVNFSVWGGMKPYSKFPGPAVWTGGSSGSGNATKDETPSSSAPVASKSSSAPVASKPSASAPVASKPSASVPVASKPSASAPVADKPSFSGRPRPSGRPLPSGRPFPRPSGKPFTYTPAAPKPTYPAPINDDEPSYTPVAPKPASPAPVNNDESSSNTPVAPTPASPAPVTDGSDKANTKAIAHTDENCGGRLARTRRAFREMFLNKA